MQDPRYPSYSAMGSVPGTSHNVAVGDSITVAPASHQPMDPPSAALLRLMRRRVPPEKRQRTEMSCDWCKKKRCKCLRGSTVDTCRACSEIGRPCTTTEPRKRRGQPIDRFCIVGCLITTDRLTAAASTTAPTPKAAKNTASILDDFIFCLGNGIDGIDDMSLDVSAADPRLLIRPSPSQDSTSLPLTVSPRDIVTYQKDDLTATTTATITSNAPSLLTPTTLAFTEKKYASDEHLFEDALGFPRYIGPLGSYTLLVKLWEVMAVWCAPNMAIQAPPCASTQTASRTQPMRPRFGSTSSISDSTIIDGADQTIQQYSSGRNIDLPPREVADVLVSLFFDKVHCDFPIFHRALFQTSYENTWASPSSPSQSPHQNSQPTTVGPEAEPAWLMCLSMVFVLGLEAASAQCSAIRRLVGNTAHREALKARYLAKVQEVLPQVIAGSMLVHVQALMLYCRYLHITRSRNACWNLTGAAIRVAVAIGLHRNGVHGKCSPLERELRRRIWWTLYAFERIECSSLGRTSAIDDAECNVGVPTEDLLDMSDILPRGYVSAHAGLMRLLGSICKQQYGGSHSDNGDEEMDNSEESSISTSIKVPQEQADFARATAESLDLWYAQLPPSLSLLPDSPKSHRRAILLLHIQHHYTVTLLCRPFLLALVAKKKPESAMAVEEEGDASSSSATLLMFARKCIEAAKSAVVVIERLFRAGLFNSKTWWDVYFIEASCMVLAMGRFVHDRNLRSDAGIIDALRTCIRILKECKEFSPTMQRIAFVTTDFAQTLVSDNSPCRAQDEQDSLKKQAQQAQQAQQDRQNRQTQQAQQNAQRQQYLAQQQQHQKYLQQHQIPYQRQAQYGFEHQPQSHQSQQQHSPLLFSGNQGISGNAAQLSRDIDDFGGEMRSRSSSSQSGSSPDDSSIPIAPANIFGNAHDPVGVSMSSSSGIAHDPFSMPWNLADISQFWGDWAEPDHWWQA
ncbi:nucleus protein [Ophiostoma piceae UAMH 11346]|uniref:Nucleus protein n=1 Tax=Ophiostoma piceae (strain UAMH 11346) TaxID=1262450 RepID=S3DA14_OPHP1|nr:nucleus protein [Ophiostoma piceae UAMH 11346]